MCSYVSPRRLFATNAQGPHNHFLQRDIDDPHNGLSRLGDSSVEEQSQDGEQSLIEETENPEPNAIVDNEANADHNVPSLTNGVPPPSDALSGSKRTRANNLEQETILREFVEAVKEVLWPAGPSETASILEETESEGEEADAEERFKRAFQRVELLVPSTIEALRGRFAALTLSRDCPMTVNRTTRPEGRRVPYQRRFPP